MQFFLYEIVARIVAIYLCFDCSHKQRKRLVVQELPGKVRAAAVSALNLNDEQRSQLVLQGRG